MTALALHEQVRGFVSRPRTNLINGKWVEAASGKRFATYNPATADVLGEVAEGDREDINRAVKAARAAFEIGPWSKMTASQRGQLLWKLGDLIEKHAEELAQLEALDNGKPISVARVADIPLSADVTRYYAGWATKIEGATLPVGTADTFLAYTAREPVGVVGAVIPWNFPLLMAAFKLAPALAAGCTIVLKPAEQTPLSALRLCELACEAGFPDGVINVVTGFGETAGAALAGHPDVDKIAFTGSTEVGKLIVQSALGNLKRVSLELGGKSPNIVFADSNIDDAIAGAASAIFFNHGQCCCAGSRLYIEQSVFDRVVEGVSALAGKIRLGDGMDPTTEMGPLVSEEQLTRVCGYLDAGKQEGARATVGGKRQGDRGYFVQPTVLVDTKPNMKVVREEIFGPVVTATPFKSIEEVIPQANDSIYGLAAGIWTQNISKANRVARQLRAGTVWINCYNVFDSTMPFGGYKQSGWGRELGKAGVELFTESKSVCTRL